MFEEMTTLLNTVLFYQKLISGFTLSRQIIELMVATVAHLDPCSLLAQTPQTLCQYILETSTFTSPSFITSARG